MKLSNLEIYNLSELLSNHIWNIVKNWPYFEKNTVGTQLVRSADSISANIAESYGRFHYKDKKNFGYYARGSLEETKSWIRKCQNRELMNKEEIKTVTEILNLMGPKLNSFINSLKYPKSKYE